MQSIRAAKQYTSELRRLAPKRNLALWAVALLMTVTACSVPVDEEISRADNRVKLSATANDSYIAATTYLPADAGSSMVKAVLVYDLNRKSWKVLVSPLPDHALEFPNLSANDPDVLFVTMAGQDKDPLTKDGAYEVAPRTLLRCHLKDQRCKPLLTDKRTMYNAEDIPGEGVLFVSAPPRISQIGAGSQWYVTFSPRNFYLLGPDQEIKRLTDVNYKRLGNISIVDDGVVFSAMLPRPGRSSPPFSEEVANQPLFKDRLYKLPVNGAFSALKVDQSIYKPVVQLGTINKPSIISSPSASRSSSYIVFLTNDRSMIKGKNLGKGYQYSFYVYDIKDDKIIAAVLGHENQTLSAPSMTKDGDVVYFDYYDDAYHIKKYSIADRTVEDVDRIDVTDILRTKRKSFTIER